MLKFEVSVIELKEKDGHQSFYAKLANTDDDDQIAGVGRTPYQAVADLVDEMNVHEYFRADNE